jgi:hypothetical protein
MAARWGINTLSGRGYMPLAAVSVESASGTGTLADRARQQVVQHASEKDAKLTQLLGQLQPFLAVLPQELHGPTCIFWANLKPFSLQFFAAMREIAERSDRLPHTHRTVLASNISMDWTCDILERQFTEYGSVQQIRAEYLPAKRQVWAAVVYEKVEDAAACVHGERDGSMTVHALTSAPVVQPTTTLISRAAGAEVGAGVAAEAAAAAAEETAAADAADEAAAITTTPLLVVQPAPSESALEPVAESNISPPLDPPSSPEYDERNSGCKSCRV